MDLSPVFRYYPKKVYKVDNILYLELSDFRLIKWTLNKSN
jgi:hypothetical protein